MYRLGVRCAAALAAACLFGAVAAPQGAAKQKQPKDQGEFDIYNEVIKDVSTNNFAKALTDLDTWKQKYPNSDYKDDREVLYVQAYNGAKQPAKALDTAAPLVARGLDADTGILGQFYREHAEFTERLREIVHWLRRDRKEGPLPVAELADSLDGYLHLMRAHVAREEELLYTLANGLLTDEDQEDILRAFATIPSTDRAELFELAERDMDPDDIDPVAAGYEWVEFARTCDDE